MADTNTAPPAPAPPPPAAPAPPVTPTIQDDPFLSAVMGDMGILLKKEPDPKPAPEPQNAPPPPASSPSPPAAGTAAGIPPAAPPVAGAAPPPAAPAAAPEPPKPKPIQVEKAKPIEEIVEDVLNKMQKEGQPKTAEPKPPLPPPANPDASFIETLDDQQKEEIKLAEFAAKAMPDKYGNMPKRLVDYLKKVDSYIEDKRKADPNWDPEEDESFSSFIEENRPEYDGADRRRIERQQIASEAEARVEARFRPRLEEAERATRTQELKPELDRAASDYRNNVLSRIGLTAESPLKPAIEKMVEKGGGEEGLKAAREVDGLAAAVIQKYSNSAAELGREVIELVSGVARQVPYNPEAAADDPSNQRALRQARLFRFIDRQEQIFARDGGDLRVRDNRTFVARREFAKLPEAEQARHWTLDHNDVLDLIAIEANVQAEREYKAETQRRADEGYIRKPAQELPKTETPPNPPPAAGSKTAESPKATVTPAPGAGSPPPQPPPAFVMPKEMLDKTFSPGVATWAG